MCEILISAFVDDCLYDKLTGLMRHMILTLTDALKIMPFSECPLTL